jgi:hypothetical protein
MKKIINPGLVIILLATLGFTACKKIQFDNYAPVANAGRDTVIILPVNSCLLDGSASTDKENNIVSYHWKLVAGPSGVNIAKPNSPQTKVENLVKGIYYFDLTVLDKVGHESKANVTVTVWDPQQSITVSVNDTTIRLPYNRVILKINDGDIYKNIIKWDKISGPNSFTIISDPGTHTRVTNLVEGVYQFEMTATYWNQMTEKDTTTITVLPENNVYTAEKLFENLAWIDSLPFSSITNNISSIIATRQQFKVYLKLDINANWEIVSPELNDPYQMYNYNYTIDNNMLKVFIHYFRTDFDDIDFGKYHLNSAIKIVY